MALIWTRRDAWLAIALSVALAAPAVEAATEADLQSAFEAMFADPGNVDLTLSYARVAIEAADYEAAIGALEGVLMMSPDLAAVRVDLGILYYRLESFAAARYHLNRALADGGLTRAQNVRAQNFLVRVDDSTGRHFISGRITAGLRYRTNANSGTDSSRVLARGFDVILDDEFQEDGDGDGFISANVRHVYDLKRQNDLALESTAFLYGNRQFDLDQVNNVTLEGTTGARFKPRPVAWKGFDVRPHFVVNGVFRDDDLLSNVYGAGIDVNYFDDRRLRISSLFQHRQRRYNNTAARPRIEQQRDGHEHIFRLNGRYLLRDNFSVLGGFDVIDRAAKADFNDTLELGLRVRGDLTYASPLAVLPGRWRFFAGGAYRDTDYDAANPAIDPLRVRDDREWRFNVGNAIPLSGRLQALIEVSGQFVDSNLPNFERDNISTTVSMSYWF